MVEMEFPERHDAVERARDRGAMAAALESETITPSV
jgi:hypothetical protein